MLGQEADITSLTWSADAALLAAAGDDGVVYIWRLANGEEVLTINAQADGATVVRWSPDGTLLATGGEDATVVLWNATSGGLYLELRDLGGPVTSLTWSPDSTMIAAATPPQGDGTDTPVRVWQAQTGEVLHTFSGPTAIRLLTGLSWSADGLQLAAGPRDALLLLWDLPVAPWTGATR